MPTAQWCNVSLQQRFGAKLPLTLLRRLYLALFAAKEAIQNVWAAIFMKKYTSWVDAFDMDVIRMQEAGLLDKFFRDPLPLQAYQRSPRDDTIVSPLGFLPFQLAFIVYCTCLAIGFFIFMVESKFKIEKVIVAGLKWMANKYHKISLIIRSAAANLAKIFKSQEAT